MRLPDAMRNAGAGLRDRALSWSNRHLADGHVPNAVLRTLNCTPQLRASLIEVGLFEDEGQGVYIHDYPEFNETKEELLVRRARAAEIGKLGGLAKKRNAKRQASGTLEALASGTPTNGLAAATEPASGTLQNPATNARPRNARPGPSPIRSSSQAPSAVPARKRPGSPTNEPRLTKAQLDGWSTFGPEWDAFKAAWIGRGLLHPPAGSPQDDDTSQRGLLWQVLDAQPMSLPRWVRAASGKTAREVITWVLAQWHEVRAEAGVEDPDYAQAKADERAAAGPAMQRIGEALVDVFGGQS